MIVAYLAPAANHYIIGYFGVALGIGAVLTVYAWSGLSNGRASMPGTDEPPDASGTAAAVEPAVNG